MLVCVVEERPDCAICRRVSGFGGTRDCHVRPSVGWRYVVSPCVFVLIAWYSETRSWDVRTKKVTYEIIPTCDGVTGIANYGPTATLFALGRNHAVFQYDINPSSTPMQVANAQHAPANTPPTPPTMLEERKNPYAESGRSLSIDQQIPFTFTDNESSADESAAMSPLQKIAKEMDSLDALESEIRDKVMPLSPHSSQASSSTSSKSSGRRRQRQYLYDRPDSSRASSDAGYDGTEFSFGPPPKMGHESMSIRSVASSLPSVSAARHTRRSSNLRREILRSPEEAQETALMDLFPTIKARLRDVAFRTPQYGNAARTPDLLLSEMLSVVFGWNDSVQSLLQDEMSRHRPGSAAAVLLAKWLGDMGADSMASMIGSESMTSSDWMLLALSSIGADSQKKVGEAFVQRLLEKGDIHPAVAILLGLGEHDDAIEVYVSQQYWLESVLLTCLTSPSDWQRISYLIRKWGEAAVTSGQPELAVRCFSCTSVETSEPWFSPRSQDAVYAAQQERFMQPLSAGGMTSPPLSPPSRSASARLTAKNASLKLITSFGDQGAPVSGQGGTARPLNTALGVTPIAQSALSPGGVAPWKAMRATREPSTARTATPGGYQSRKRLPSRDDIARAKQEAAELATPMTAAREKSSSRASNLARRDQSADPVSAVRQGHHDVMRRVPDVDDGHLPSPAQGVFSRLKAEPRTSDSPRERKPGGLQVEIMDTAYTDALSPGPSTDASSRSRQGAFSPMTDGSTRSGRGRAIDAYISSVEEARVTAREVRASSRAQSRHRNRSRKRGESRSGRTSSRMRERSEGRKDVRYIKPAKRSPSSPVPMSPEEIAQASSGAQQTQPEPATTDDENFYKMNIASPTESQRSGRTKRKSAEKAQSRAADKFALIGGLAPLQLGGERGRSQNREIEPPLRSPSLPTLSSKRFGEADDDDAQQETRSFRMRARSISRQPGDDLQSRRQASRALPERSSSRRPSAQGEQIIANASEVFGLSAQAGGVSLDTSEPPASVAGQPRARNMTRKQIAAQELEARRRSLARRPSAPSIPLPGDLLAAGRPPMPPRYHTDLGESPTTYESMARSHTVDPDVMARYNNNNNNQAKVTGTSTPSAPIGLPATPRAMRHPRYMSSDPNERDGDPPVPRIPGQYSELSSLGSSLSQVTGSALSQMSSSDQQPSLLSSVQHSTLSESSDSIGPLLPATVFGQKGQALPSRSASAPPENQSQVHPLYKPTLPSSNRRLSAGRGHVRKISPPDVNIKFDEQPISIDAALYDEDQVIIIPEADMGPPPMLAELQHLAGPPPPPPPPTMYQHQRSGSGVINIAIDEHGADSPGPTLPMPMERAQTTSPSQHRKNAPSGSWMRGFGDRMRSSSKSRAKSPPTVAAPAPYETVLPPMPGYTGHVRHESFSQQRAQSPYEQAMAAQNQGQIPIPPPPPPAPTHGPESKLNETSIPPVMTLPSRSQSSTGYRNPKEIRANMPPETLQQGVYNGSGGMI